MRADYLSEYFSGVAAKRLSRVEADILASHQHEFNGVSALRVLLGEPSGKVRFDATLLYLDDNGESVSEEGSLTWYDAREKGRLERGTGRSEYRLYFPTTRVSDLASVGDLLIIGLMRNGRLLVVVAADESSAARQIGWLFKVADASQKSFLVREELDREEDRIALTSTLILESIGIAVEPPPQHLDLLLKRFGTSFPGTREFSEFARTLAPVNDPLGNPDATLMAWMETEERLFRTLERHLISERLSQGFVTKAGEVSVDEFLQFSLSVQNRRKSRVGYAFENHLAAVFLAHALRFDHTAVTENRSKPDFLFPGAHAYHDTAFATDGLTVLGAKSTCKDRWRQVLAEADRVEIKHLVTLEAAISRQQTCEMAQKRLQLIVPRALHDTYTSDQQAWLMDLSQFIDHVRSRQIACPDQPRVKSNITLFHG